MNRVELSQNAFGEMVRTSRMPDSIRTADPHADRALLTDLLTHNLSRDAGGRRFEWLYLENPHGLARSFVAIQEGTGRALGVAAAFPRRLLVGGSVRLGYVLGDFCIDRRHRSLGLALRLQRACLEQIGSTPSLLAYDFPSVTMMAIYRRMQIPPAGQMLRWAKPVKIDRKIGGVVKSRALAGMLSAPINELLRWKDLSNLSTGGWTILKHDGNCKEEFTKLAHSVGSRYGSCVERSAHYLNWRYLRHPLVPHELLTARRGKDLMGYVVFSHTGEDARIVDLFGFGETGMWTALVAQVVGLLRNRGVVTVSMPALATNPWTGLLKRWGFRPRESSPLVVYAPRSAEDLSQDSADPWFMMDGDRES